MNELTELLADGDLSEWARWLITSDNPGARESALFLENTVLHLSERARQSVRGRRNADSGSVDALLHELLVYETSYILGLKPDFEPEINGLTPDLTLNIAGQKYIADVFLTNRPTKTLATTLTRFGVVEGYRDRGEASKKIADIISEKAVRYRRLGFPLLLFVAFAGYDIREHDVEVALYGDSLYELLSRGLALPRRVLSSWIKRSPS
jgi:hypothetical protein